MNRITSNLATLSTLLAAMLSSPAPAQTQPPDLPLVTNPPYLGTYYSLAFTNWPALPMLPLDVPVYLLYTDPTNGPIYAYDDRGVDYTMISPMTASTDGSALGPLYANYIGGDCGCAPWLTIDSTGPNAVLVTAHRLVAGQTCSIYSSTNITVPFTNWAFETNLVAAVGPATALINMASRPNLFFRAAVAAYQATNYIVDTNFVGLTIADTSVYVPDTMGSSGGNDDAPFFLEVLNGGSGSKAVYNAAGALLSASTNGNDSIGGTTDGRVLWDPHARRWIISSLASFSSVALAVSKTENPTDLSTNNWYTNTFDISGTGQADFDTLGLDDNGIYFSVIRLTNSLNTYSGNTIVAVKKPEVYQGRFISQRRDIYITNAFGAVVQPVLNFDHVASNGYAWLLTKAPPDFGAAYQAGAILYAKLQWSGTNIVLTTNWDTITDATSTYRDYYDLGITNIFAPEATAISNGKLNLWPIGSRLAMSCIRNGYVWACQAIGLSGTNGSFTNAVFLGDQSVTNVDRSGIQWFKLRVDTESGTLSHSAHCRVYDNAITNAVWYHYPSIMANCAGDMITCFSGSSPTNYTSAFFAWRLSDGTQSAVPTLIRAGTSVAGDVGQRWGDYSATSGDPADDHSFWTVQQIPAPVNPDGPSAANWETIIARIKSAP